MASNKWTLECGCVVKGTSAPLGFHGEEPVRFHSTCENHTPHKPNAMLRYCKIHRTIVPVYEDGPFSCCQVASERERSLKEAARRCRERAIQRDANDPLSLGKSLGYEGAANLILSPEMGSGEATANKEKRS